MIVSKRPMEIFSLKDWERIKTTKKIKILIGIPINGSVSKDLVKRLAKLQGNFEVLFMPDSPKEKEINRKIRIGKAREKIIKYFLKKNFDYLLFLDSDVYIQPQTLKTMINTPGDKIHVCYTKRNGKELVTWGLGCVLLKNRNLLKGFNFRNANYDLGEDGWFHYQMALKGAKVRILDIILKHKR